MKDTQASENDESHREETARERRRRLLKELLEDIRATRGGFRASDNVPRDELYERRR